MRKPLMLAGLLFCLIAAITSCNRQKPSAPVSAAGPTATPAGSEVVTASPAKNAPMLDACSLLTSQEIETALGEPLKNTKPSGKADGGLEVSQCYLELPTAANSISLTVNQKGHGAGARDPKGMWEEIFHREHESEPGEKEEKKSKPVKVDGLGDECFWTGNPIGGALYILKGNAYVRISVGGAGDQEVKIKKCRALGEAVLKRL